jgi:osmotically-inducible protein OsmY
MTLRKNNDATKTANSGQADHPYVPDGHGRTDEQIRADVHQLLGKEAQNISGLFLSVQDGVVTLQGEVQSHADQQRVSQQIRALPSVKSLDDRLRLAASTVRTSH